MFSPKTVDWESCIGKQIQYLLKLIIIIKTGQKTESNYFFGRSNSIKKEKNRFLLLVSFGTTYQKMTDGKCAVKE